MGRLISELDPKVQAAAYAALGDCKLDSIDVLVTCTYRSPEEQNALFAQGRTKAGPKVTNAKANQSFHQFHVALDCYPIVHGKPDFSGTSPMWEKMAAIFKKHGFEWAGEWKHFRELPHFQMTGGHDLAHFQAGGKL